MSQLHAATIKDVLFFFCENLCAQQTGFARCGCRQDTHARTHTKLYCFSLENVFSPRRILKLYQYLLLLFFQVTNPLQFYILWGESSVQAKKESGMRAVGGVWGESSVHAKTVGGEAVGGGRLWG